MKYLGRELDLGSFVPGRLGLEFEFQFLYLLLCEIHGSPDHRPSRYLLVSATRRVVITGRGSQSLAPARFHFHLCMSMAKIFFVSCLRPQRRHSWFRFPSHHVCKTHIPLHHPLTFACRRSGLGFSYRAACSSGYKWQTIPRRTAAFTPFS